MKEPGEQLNLIGTGDINEWRIFGPPGTGKTTYTARQVGRAVAKHGPDAVLVTSFSRAAAAELVARDLPVNRDHVGTLHAHCYRALGKPPLAQGTAISDWNEQYPHWSITGSKDSGLDEPSGPEGSTEGDRLLSDVSRWRNRLLPIEYWPHDSELHRFWKTFKGWKDSHGVFDFTDLLEQAHRDCRIAPGDPKVIFGDEAQDFSRLQLKLIRRWGSYADYFVIVGDDDQCIYTFSGSTPHAMLEPDIPAAQKIVLSQSYRVPIAVHRLACRWIAQVTKREPKEYLPRPEEGSVEHFEANETYAACFMEPERILDYAEEEAARGRTVMLLAACSYMLQAIRRALVERGVPFHNPYRRIRGDWNPLWTGRGTTAAERLQRFAKPHHSLGDDARLWTADDYRKWAEWLVAARTFVTGGKTGPRSIEDTDEITLDQLRLWLQPDSYKALVRGIMEGPFDDHLRWWLSRVSESHARTASYPVQVALNRGMDALTERPKIIIGTIHSVKGGEADTVFLFPDLSTAGYKEWIGAPDERDAVVRQFYVGMTRARHKLVICAASGEMGVEL